MKILEDWQLNLATVVSSIFFLWFLRSYPVGAYTPSLCSPSAGGRGPAQRVVAYTIYGTFVNPKAYMQYWGQIEDRLNEVAKYYPGEEWKCLPAWLHLSAWCIM